MFPDDGDLINCLSFNCFRVVSANFNDYAVAMGGTRFKGVIVVTYRYRQLDNYLDDETDNIDMTQVWGNGAEMERFRRKNIHHSQRIWQEYRMMDPRQRRDVDEHMMLAASVMMERVTFEPLQREQHADHLQKQRKRNGMLALFVISTLAISILGYGVVNDWFSSIEIFMTYRMKIEGLAFFVAGIGLFAVIPNGDREMNLFRASGGLFLSALIFIGMGIVQLFIDEALVYGTSYMVAGVGLVILVMGWLRYSYRIPKLASLLILGSFMMLGMEYIRQQHWVIGLCFIGWGVGFAFSELLIRPTKKPSLMIFIFFITWLTSAQLLGGNLIFRELLNLITADTGIFANPIDAFLIEHFDAIGKISFLASGVGVIGIMFWYLINVSATIKRNMQGSRIAPLDILMGIHAMLAGIGFIGLAIVVNIMSIKETHDGVMSTILAAGLIFSAICGICYVKIGFRSMLQGEILSGKDSLCSFICLIGFSMKWFYFSEFVALWITSAIFLFAISIFISTGGKIYRTNRGFHTLLAFVFIMSSLAYGASLIYSGLNLEVVFGTI